MSQENLADRAGIHRTQLSQIERGVASATLDSIVAFAEALEIDEALLLAEPSEKPVPLKVGRKKAETPADQETAPKRSR
jgi:transcriptional regulator with XRE-family HTH domain